MRWMPFESDHSLGSTNKPAKLIDANLKGILCSAWGIRAYLSGPFCASGQPSNNLTCCIETALEPDKFIETFNQQGEGLDEEDKWTPTKHPIESMTTTNYAYLPGTTRCTDATKLGEAINEKLNALKTTSRKQYIYCKLLHITKNAKERQLLMTNPTEAPRHTPATHIIRPTEDHHEILPLIMTICDPKKNLTSPSK